MNDLKRIWLTDSLEKGHFSLLFKEGSLKTPYCSLLSQWESGRVGVPIHLTPHHPPLSLFSLWSMSAKTTGPQSPGTPALLRAFPHLWGLFWDRSELWSWRWYISCPHLGYQNVCPQVTLLFKFTEQSLKGYWFMVLCGLKFFECSLISFWSYVS